MLKATKLKFDNKPVWKIWTTVCNGKTFQIDGQNFEDTTGEWQIFEEVINHFGKIDLEWWDTVPTKKQALIDIEKKWGNA